MNRWRRRVSVRIETMFCSLRRPELQKLTEDYSLYSWRTEVLRIIYPGGSKVLRLTFDIFPLPSKLDVVWKTH